MKLRTMLSYLGNTVANTLAYYNVTRITAVKRFVVQAPGACTIKLFTAVIVAVS
jgi:hypothetical protein